MIILSIWTVFLSYQKVRLLKTPPKQWQNLTPPCRRRDRDGTSIQASCPPLAPKRARLRKIEPWKGAKRTTNHRWLNIVIQYKSKETPQLIGLFSPNLVITNFIAMLSLWANWLVTKFGLNVTLHHKTTKKSPEMDF